MDSDSFATNMATATEAPAHSYRGRGRGRGIRPIPEGLVVPLRRPHGGEQVAQSRPSLDEISRRMQHVTKETVEEDATQLMNMIRSYANDSKHLQDVANNLYKLALKSSNFGIIASELTKRMANIEVDGAKFRNLMLKLLQSDFVKRDDLRRDSLNSWLGFVAFLVELFAVLRTQNGDVLKALSKPTFVSLTELLSSRDSTSAEEELEHCVGLLKQRGRFLQDQDVANMECLLKALRDKLLDIETSAYGRCLLLEVLEMSARGWGLSDDIKEYYREVINRY